MPGANNSASGVALLLETARVLGSLPVPPVGIDFVFLRWRGRKGPKSLGDGDPQGRPLGSSYFAQNLEDFYPDTKPEQAILFDMVCAKNLELSPEPLSLTLVQKPEAEKILENRRDCSARHFPAGSLFPIQSTATTTPFIKAAIPAFLVTGLKDESWLNTTGGYALTNVRRRACRPWAVRFLNIYMRCNGRLVDILKNPVRRCGRAFGCLTVCRTNAGIRQARIFAACQSFHYTRRRKQIVLRRRNRRNGGTASSRPYVPSRNAKRFRACCFFSGPISRLAFG